METKNFKAIAPIGADYVISAEFFTDCAPTDFSGFVLVGKLFDPFGADTGTIIGISVTGGRITATVPADSVTYCPAIYVLTITGTDGSNVFELIRVNISYIK